MSLGRLRPNRDNDATPPITEPIDSDRKADTMNAHRVAIKSLATAAVFAGLASIGAPASAQTASATPTTQSEKANVSTPATAAKASKDAAKPQVAMGPSNFAGAKQNDAARQAQVDALAEYYRFIEVRHLEQSW